MYQNSKIVDKEVEEAIKKLKILEIKQIIEIKRESIAKMMEKNVIIYRLKQSLLTKQQENDEIEKQVEFLNKQTRIRMKHLKELKNEFNKVKLLLERQYTECKATVKDMLDQKSSINQSIAEYMEEIKTFEVMT